MRVCLINAPTVAEFEGTKLSEIENLEPEYPPLGILSLAAVLEQRGMTPQLVDLDGLFCDTAVGDCRAGYRSFFDRATEELQKVKAGVFGFGTISSSYPLTLRLAREVKRAHPSATIVLGGPQATAVDLETIEAFPFVDIIVRGEAEDTLPELLDALGSPRELAGVAGITFRHDGKAARTPGRPPPELEQLPAPAFHLWPSTGKGRTLPVEAGRGCPFACTFCSTSQFFRRRFRLKPPAVIIGQMKALLRRYPAQRIDLVHDAFTVDRERVVAFCEALLDANGKFRWTCSARTDCVDKELLALMARAGCEGIFYGVESGSTRVQRAIGKRLELGPAMAAIREADRRRMLTSVSLIAGFPEERPEDLRGTVDFLMDALRFARVRPQFHLLSPLAGTAVHEAFRGRLYWDGIYSDMAKQGWCEDSPDLALILEFPDIFPNFYAVPNPFLDRPYLRELRDFISYSVERFRWLTVALHQRGGGLLNVFELWRAWRVRNRPGSCADGPYHAGAAFRKDFLEFAAANYCRPGDAEAIAVATLVEYETQLARIRAGAAERRETCSEPAAGSPAVDGEMVPRVASGVPIVHLEADYRSIIDRLRKKQSPRNVPRRPTVVAIRDTSGGGAEIVQLGPLPTALLKLCDGNRSIRDIAAIFPQLDEDLAGMPPEAACLFSLNELASQRLLAFEPATD